MNIDAIYGATSWTSTQQATSTNNSSMKETDLSAIGAASSGGGNSGNQEEETTTKITTTADGETVMVVMQGDEVIKTVKLGGGAPMLKNTPNGQEQQYVENCNTDIGSIFSSAI